MFRNPDGTPATFGVPRSNPQAGMTAGLIITRQEQRTMAKAEQDGYYTLPTGGRFKVRTGDVLPEGAVVDGDTEQSTTDAPEERSKGAAPDNKARGQAPEDRSK